MPVVMGGAPVELGPSATVLSAVAAVSRALMAAVLQELMSTEAAASRVLMAAEVSQELMAIAELVHLAGQVLCVFRIEVSRARTRELVTVVGLVCHAGKVLCAPRRVVTLPELVSGRKVTPVGRMSTLVAVSGLVRNADKILRVFRSEATLSSLVSVSGGRLSTLVLATLTPEATLPESISV